MMAHTREPESGDDSPLPSAQAQQLKLGSIYKHYKTKGLYIALQLVKNTGNGQGDRAMVLYFSLTTHQMFVRPLDEFTMKVRTTESNYGASVFRFELQE